MLGWHKCVDICNGRGRCRTADPTVESPADFDAGRVSRRWAGVWFWPWCCGLEVRVGVHRGKGTVGATVIGFVAVGHGWKDRLGGAERTGGHEGGVKCIPTNGRVDGGLLAEGSVIFEPAEATGAVGLELARSSRETRCLVSPGCHTGWLHMIIGRMPIGWGMICPAYGERLGESAIVIEFAPRPGAGRGQCCRPGTL